MRAEKQKTYGRFLGMIFPGEPQAVLVAERQRVAEENMIKKWQTRKIVGFLRINPGFFCHQVLCSRKICVKYA
jgi:hypothetical protein